MGQNLGGYDKYSFNESVGNRILQDLLESTRLIKTHFAEGDKGPNLDGYFELLEHRETKSVPVGKIEVQIKSMEHDITNDNTTKNISDYKYSCDTKVINAAKNEISKSNIYFICRCN